VGRWGLLRGTLRRAGRQRGHRRQDLARLGNAMKTEKNIDDFVSQALAIEAEDARDAGAVGFMARVLVQATMPHGRTDALHYQRTNGDFRLTMTASPNRGLPFGPTPRLLLAWLNTEAVRTKSRELVLGNNLSDFMRQLDMVPTGGRWGSITRLRDHSRRLFGCMVECDYIGEPGREQTQRFLLTDQEDLWWSPSPDQKTLWQSTITLSERFFDEIVTRPVPVDLRALKALRHSAMALDTYTWLTYRMHTLKRPITIPWKVLQGQLGAGFSDTTQGTRDFKKAFRQHLTAVQVIYPAAKVEPAESGLSLRPSAAHVGRQKLCKFTVNNVDKAVD